MSINKHLRVVVSTILISGLIIMMTVFCPFGQTVCYAADAIIITLSKPSWNYDELSFSEVTLDAGAEQVFTNISITTQKGYICSLPSSVLKGDSETDTISLTWTTDDLLEEVTNSSTGEKSKVPLQRDGKRLYKTAFCNLGSSGETAATIKNILKAVSYKLEDDDDDIQIAIDINGEDTTLPTVEGYHITRGPDDAEGNHHYYLYVPYTDAEKQADAALFDDNGRVTTWSKAYDRAKSLKLMGMDGYLVTITSEAEDIILDNITTKGAWAGAAMIKKDYTFTGSSSFSDWFEKPPVSGGSENNYSAYAWRWVCGPETGNSIKISNGYVAGPSMKAYSPDSGYSNWVLKIVPGDGETEGDRPYRGDEPNNFNGEYCMQVHYTSVDGNSVNENKNGVLGWNDLPDYGREFVDGYFVEFSGDMEPSEIIHASSAQDPELYNHEWVYEPSAEGNVIYVSCNNPDHVHDIYKKSDDDTSREHKIVKIQIDAVDSNYTADSYSSAEVKAFEENGAGDLAESDLSKFGIASSDIETIKYKKKGESDDTLTETKPVDVGEYTAVTTIHITNPEHPDDPDGRIPITITGDFVIKPAELEIVLNEQTASSSGVDKTYNEEGGAFDEGAGLVYSANLLSNHKLYIPPKAVYINKTLEGDKMIDVDLDSVEVLDASGNPVTKNYLITVIPASYSGTEAKVAIQDTTNELKIEFTYGKKLSEVTDLIAKANDDIWVMVDADNNTPVGGTFSWKTQEIADYRPKVADNGIDKIFKAIFTPTDPTYPDTTPVDVKVVVKPKPIGDPTVVNVSKFGINTDRNPSVTIKDSQLAESGEDGKVLSEGTDYTVTATVNEDENKVTLEITGKGNYTGTYPIYVPTWYSEVKTEVYYDANAKELNPYASEIDKETAEYILSFIASKEKGTDKEKANRIINLILNKGYSTEGNFEATVKLVLRNADDTAPETEKTCAAQAIGATKDSKSISSDAKIAMYFDISMMLNSNIKAQPDDVSVMDINDYPIRDIAEGVFAEDYPGANELIKITVPVRYRPNDGYTRKYDIIRVHQNEPDGELVWDIMDTTQGDNYELSFTTDKFSTYALAYTETKKDDPKKDDPKKDDPKKDDPKKDDPKKDDPKKDEPKQDEPVNNTDNSNNNNNNEQTVVSTPTPTPTPAAPATQVVAPKTGDKNDPIIAGILVLSGIVMMAIALLKKRTDAGRYT